MRILFLNRAFPPGVEATGQYLHELVGDLSRNHEVTVVCGVPYSNGLEGRVFPYRHETSGPVAVRRAWGTRLPKRIPAGRIVNQVSFFAMAALALRGVDKPDVVVSMTDPPFLGLLGLHLKRRFGASFVYYCEDLYPDVAEAVGMAPRWLAGPFRRVQAAILAGADRIVALSDDMAERLLRKGVDAERLTVVRNWADTEAIHPVKRDNEFRRLHGLEGRFVVMYSGNFGYVWDLEAALDVAAQLRGDPRIAFVLIGAGSTRPRIEERIRTEGLTNVLLLPFQPKDELAQSLSAADLHLVPMRSGVFGTVVPSKIYGILASGTPMAALAESESETARVISQHACGWYGAPGDVEGLTDFVRAASLDGDELHEMGSRGRCAAETSYARSILTARFESVLESVHPPADDAEDARQV
ncbi:MAG: glycosyltransferase family 4 protein [Gemmatimonadales bacterium]|jgi:glycosyltransferase involved in cell wall biosynthesis